MRQGIAILAALSACGRVSFEARSDAGADAFEGCDAPGGRWNDVPGGGFESGDLAGWNNNDIPAVGTATVVQSPVAVGNYAVQMTPTVTAFTGYALRRFVPVTPGMRYVLSGYLDASTLTGAQSLYFDLNDVPFDIDVAASVGVAGWQFVSRAVTIPAGVTMVEVRVVHDGDINAAQPGYADEIALTPEAIFAGPGAACN